MGIKVNSEQVCQKIFCLLEGGVISYQYNDWVSSQQSLFHNVVRMFSSLVTIIFVHFHINIICSSPGSPGDDSIQHPVTLSCDAPETWFLCSFKTHSNSSVVCAVQTETNIIQDICSENKVGSARGKRSKLLLEPVL